MNLSDIMLILYFVCGIIILKTRVVVQYTELLRIKWYLYYLSNKLKYIVYEISSMYENCGVYVKYRQWWFSLHSFNTIYFVLNLLSRMLSNI